MLTMHWLLALAIPTLTFCSPTGSAPRQLPGLFFSPSRGQQVIQTVKDLQVAVQALDAKVQAYDGTGPSPTEQFGGKNVFLGVVNVHTINRLGFNNATLSGTFTVAETVNLVNEISNTVAQSIPLGVQHLRAKKTLFYSKGLAPAVTAGLQLLQNDHDTFSAIVGARLNYFAPLDKINAAAKLGIQVHQICQEAIDDFATPPS